MPLVEASLADQENLHNTLTCSLWLYGAQARGINPIPDVGTRMSVAPLR